jgi:Na+:H+ antiporter, NhaA family
MERARRHLANRIARALTRALGGDATAGVLLILVAAAAMIAANSPLAHGYHALFHARLPLSPIPHLSTLHAWINDGLMAVFFFTVGLEIKREVLDGELATPARRRLPVLAAAAGMAAPALVFLAVAGQQPGLARGWAIPAATDIAFAVGIIGLLGNRVPPSLRLFLLTVAIVDDLGAVAIIALFYTAELSLPWLFTSLAVLAVMVVLARLRIGRALPYVLLSFALWFCMLHSGVHATVAGVLAAFTIPLRVKRGDSLLLRFEHALVPWNGLIVVPLFGFANAGVSLGGTGLAPLLDPLPLGIALGLFVGKQAGVLGAILLAERTGFAARPDGAGRLQLWGMALLCGIGFTMSLFIGALAFPAHPELAEEAKLGVLAGSLASALAGYLVLRLAPRPG